ncbi:MAG TPA: transglutaminase-like domain-containing protein [Gemmatimonadaceae bacterium]|nr:transglutaminase-like domain-containing protein [Gemmatimonadaceae bacterium]
MLAGLIVLLWLAGLGFLVRREYFRPSAERLAQTGMRITPNALFYAVMQGDRQIGFASSTLDTAATTISADDYLTADLPVGGRTHRATAHTHVVLTRAFHTKAFIVTVNADGGPMSVRGRVLGDSVLALRIETGGDTAAEQRYPLTGPILLPSLVPLAIALGERPSVGRRYALLVFDPMGMMPREISVEVRAESSFVVHDSSAFDRGSNRWRAVLPDTLHAFELATAAGAGGAAFSGWVDDQGRVVQTAQLGFELRRLPYEVAFENWRLARGTASRAAPVARAHDILETTAIAASRAPRDSVERLRVLLENAQLAGFDLAGGRQRLSGDTLTITQEGPRALQAHYLLPFSGRRSPFTRAEPLIESDAPEIRQLAARIVGGEQDPLTAAQLINRWVHDSLRKKVTLGIPDALRVLHARAGDCNEHTQLYVALARAAGLPARVAAGVAFVDGKFYYHAWPEVLLGSWVAVDPTFGQFPADAAHLRFTVGGLGRQAELLRLMGRLRIEVLD